MEAMIINVITRDRGFGYPLHPTTIAYIKFLITPYAESINAMKTIDEIEQRIHSDFSSEISEIVFSALTADVNRDGNQLENTKLSVIKSILEELIAFVVHAPDNYKFETIVLPWDVQQDTAISDELYDYKKLFEINFRDNMLPVSITIENNMFTHLLSMEFTCGLLLF
jgi:hypothetical protein